MAPVYEPGRARRFAYAFGFRLALSRNEALLGQWLGLLAAITVTGVSR